MDTDLIVGKKTPEGARRGLVNLVIMMGVGWLRGSRFTEPKERLWRENKSSLQVG